MEEERQIERIFIKMGKFNKQDKKDYSNQLQSFIEGYRARKEKKEDGNIRNRNNVQEHV